MIRNSESTVLDTEEFALLGKDTVAYVKELSGSEVSSAILEDLNLDKEDRIWGLFAADGNPLMFSNQPDQVVNGAFYNDLKALLPN